MADLIAQDPFRARRPSDPGARTPLGVRPGMRGLKTGDVDGLSPYLPGGDIRMIDWRGFARSGELRLKEREREAHSAVMLVADLGSHMRFGTAGGTLAYQAALAVARHAWTALRRDEPVGIAVSGPGLVARPARGRKRLMHALDRLADAFGQPPEGGKPLTETLEEAARVLKSADELQLFTDFHYWNRAGGLSPPETARSVRCIAFQVNDAVHSDMPPSGIYPARSDFASGSDETFHLRTDHRDHAKAVSAVSARLSRQLEAEGWRVAGARSAASGGEPDVA